MPDMKQARPGALPFDPARRVMTDAEAGNLKHGDRVLVCETQTGHCYKAEVQLRTPDFIQVRLDRTAAIMKFERDQPSIVSEDGWQWAIPHPPHCEDGAFHLRTTDIPTAQIPASQESDKIRMRRLQETVHDLSSRVEALESIVRLTVTK